MLRMPDKSQMLNDAIKTIGEYCKEQMPAGWYLHLNFSADEVIADLTDPDGDDHWGWDGDSDPVTDACDYAIHAQAEMDVEAANGSADRLET